MDKNSHKKRNRPKIPKSRPNRPKSRSNRPPSGYYTSKNKSDKPKSGSEGSVTEITAIRTEGANVNTDKADVNAQGEVKIKSRRTLVPNADVYAGLAVNISLFGSSDPFDAQNTNEKWSLDKVYNRAKSRLGRLEAKLASTEGLKIPVEKFLRDTLQIISGKSGNEEEQIESENYVLWEIKRKVLTDTNKIGKKKLIALAKDYAFECSGNFGNEEEKFSYEILLELEKEGTNPVLKSKLQEIGMKRIKALANGKDLFTLLNEDIEEKLVEEVGKGLGTYFAESSTQSDPYKKINGVFNSIGFKVSSIRREKRDKANIRENKNFVEAVEYLLKRSYEQADLKFESIGSEEWIKLSKVYKLLDQRKTEESLNLLETFPIEVARSKSRFFRFAFKKAKNLAENACELESLINDFNFIKAKEKYSSIKNIHPFRENEKYNFLGNNIYEAVNIVKCIENNDKLSEQEVNRYKTPPGTPFEKVYRSAKLYLRVCKNRELECLVNEKQDLETISRQIPTININNYIEQLEQAINILKEGSELLNKSEYTPAKSKFNELRIIRDLKRINQIDQNIDNILSGTRFFWEGKLPKAVEKYNLVKEIRFGRGLVLNIPDEVVRKKRVAEDLIAIRTNIYNEDFDLAKANLDSLEGSLSVTNKELLDEMCERHKKFNQLKAFISNCKEIDTALQEGRALEYGDDLNNLLVTLSTLIAYNKRGSKSDTIKKWSSFLNAYHDACKLERNNDLVGAMGKFEEASSNGYWLSDMNNKIETLRAPVRLVHEFREYLDKGDIENAKECKELLIQGEYGVDITLESRVLEDEEEILGAFDMGQLVILDNALKRIEGAKNERNWISSVEENYLFENLFKKVVTNLDKAEKYERINNQSNLAIEKYETVSSLIRENSTFDLPAWISEKITTFKDTRDIIKDLNIALEAGSYSAEELPFLAEQFRSKQAQDYVNIIESVIELNTQLDAKDFENIDVDRLKIINYKKLGKESSFVASVENLKDNLARLHEASEYIESDNYDGAYVCFMSIKDNCQEPRLKEYVEEKARDYNPARVGLREKIEEFKEMLDENAEYCVYEKWYEDLKNDALFNEDVKANIENWFSDFCICYEIINAQNIKGDKLSRAINKYNNTKDTLVRSLSAI